MELGGRRFSEDSRIAENDFPRIRVRTNDQNKLQRAL